MKLLRTYTMGLLLLAKSTGVSGQKEPVSQDATALAKEGDPIQLNCSYTETEYNLQWYKQYPRGGLQDMALMSSSGAKSYDSYVMSLDTKSRTTSLYLNSTRLQDSAIYFCALSHSGVICQDKVEQDWLVFSREGETSTISCKYETTFISLQWYQQFPGERPTHLLTITGTEGRKPPNFSADYNKGEKSSRLKITGVQQGDAATYFCAVEAQ